MAETWGEWITSAPGRLYDSVSEWTSSVVETVGSAGEAVNPGTHDGYATGLDLAQSQYKFQYKVFPTDIGMDYLGHYMVININVPTEGFKLNGLELRSAAGQYTNQFTPLQQVSKVDVLRWGGGGISGGSRPAASVIPRQTRRIAESIALFMPQGLHFRKENDYEDISMTETAGKVGVGIGTALSALPVVGSAIGGAIAGIGSGLQPGGGLARASQLAQNPINPAVEVLFSTTKLRSFVFTFVMAPRNEQESIALKEIIKTLEFHSSPEINTGGGGLGIGATWIPPAEFDITFFNKGVENMNLKRINTSVLKRFEVSYEESGNFIAFRNGHPAMVRMELEFIELEPVHKQRILQGF